MRLLGDNFLMVSNLSVTIYNEGVDATNNLKDTLSSLEPGQENKTESPEKVSILLPVRH
jgi:hypothetical protein